MLDCEHPNTPHTLQIKSLNCAFLWFKSAWVVATMNIERDRWAVMNQILHALWLKRNSILNAICSVCDAHNLKR